MTAIKIKNHAEREAREHLVRSMIDAGKSQNEIARHLGVTPQSVHKFLKTRGWKTVAMAQLAKESDFDARVAAAAAEAAAFETELDAAPEAAE